MVGQRQVGSQMDAQLSTVDLRGKENFFAKRVAGGYALCGAGQLAAGVIQEGRNTDYHTTVATGNQLKVVTAAALAVNVKVASDAAGKAVAAAVGDEVLGVILEPSSGAGVMALIEFRPEGVLKA
jgi:ABC-type histidine transport system ATPase subunit